MATTIPAGEFKAKCLRLLDEVAAAKEPLIITKHGRPVAQLTPLQDDSAASLFGMMKSTVTYSGDLISPIEADWEANL